MRGAAETGYQVISEQVAGGWSVFRIDPPSPGQAPTGYHLPVDALRALQRYLDSVTK